MTKKIGLMYLVLTLALGLFLTVGCAKKPVPAEPAAAETAQPAPAETTEPSAEESAGIQEEQIAEAPVTEQAAPALPAGESATAVPDLQRVFFEFDQYTLTPDAQQALAGNAQFMQARPDAKVLIEGHCDERGSDEYNLALGERRARAAQDYMISLGIAPERLSTISYGEEQPLEPTSNEAAWAKNRRAEFKAR